MGYSRIVQYGDIVEYYQYEKRINYEEMKRRANIASLRRMKNAKRKKQYGLVLPKSERAIRRAKHNFFKRVYSALQLYGRPCLITLTMYEENVSLTQGYRFIADFKKNVKNQMGKTISYIAVPEWQKKGRLHYHLLCWGFSEKEIKQERNTRNLQRQYRRGYLDARLAYDNSPKLASYIAKYMAKAKSDIRLADRKGYSASRDIKPPRQAGANSLDGFASEIIGEEHCIDKKDIYDTKWLGKCIKTVYKIKK